MEYQHSLQQNGKASIEAYYQDISHYSSTLTKNLYTEMKSKITEDVTDPELYDYLVKLTWYTHNAYASKFNDTEHLRICPGTEISFTDR